MDSDLLIPYYANVRRAMQQLEASEGKTLFVVDDENVLLGSLTDGDVRRWILGGGDLDGRVDAVCNRDPVVVRDPLDADGTRPQVVAKGIAYIPVVDESHRVIEVQTREQIFGNEQHIETELPKVNLPVVIMAGGLGTRMSPFTTVLPKPLIPIGGQTVIEMIVERFTDYGVDDFYLSVNYKSKIIKSYFEELEPPYSVRYIAEEKPLGTAGSLYKLAGSIDGDLMVTNCDVLVSADYHDLTKHHGDRQNDITIVVSLKNYSIPYGVCEIENGGTLREIREKPQFDFLVNTGLYVLRSNVLDLIPHDDEFHFTDLINAVKARNGRVGVYPISDKAWIDTGEWTEYREAVAALSADRRKARSPQ